MWFLMRQAAVLRHRILHIVFEGGDPGKWKAHEATIKAFYGF